MALALFGGALIGVIQRKDSSGETLASAAKSGLRTASGAHDEVDFGNGESAQNGKAADSFSKIPHAARRAPPAEGESPLDLSAEAVAARKLAALEEILASIGSFPGLPEEHEERLARYAAQLATAENPRVQCWSPDTPPEIVYAYLRVEQKIARAAGLSVQSLQVADRWSRTAVSGSNQNTQGLPVTVTWSIVPDGTAIPATDAGESSDPSNLRARLTAIYGGNASGNPTAQPWFPMLQVAFDNLAAISGLRFVYEANDDGVGIDGSPGNSDWGIQGTRGDIRLSGHDIDGSSGVLAYAYYPDAGDVVIDTNDSFFSVTSNNSIGLRNVMEHELGHALGLDHVCPVNETKLMEPIVTSLFRGSQFDDIYSHQRNYGDPLEVHDAVRTNDSAANATPLSVVNGTTSSWQWLSIDDNSDTDFFSITATTQQELTVRVIPSDPILPNDPVNDTYLEGSQNFDGSCSDGTAFDPTNQQDLVLDLLGPNGSSVIATAPAQAAGVTEQISAFRVPANGTQYIRVRGGTNESAQLYRLEVLRVDAPSEPRLSITSTRLVAESNSGENGVPDPDETIRLGITLANDGSLAAGNISATLSAPGGSTLFSGTANYGTIAPGGLGEQLFTFALAGSPGQTVNLTLSLSAGTYSKVLPLALTLGTMVPNTPLDEHFDASASLPAGWSQSTFKTGSPWVISTNRFNSSPRSAFSPSVTQNGEATLFSPSMSIGPQGGTLEFQHRYDLESRSDGGVLEASLDGGAWFDLLNSAATVVTGDYNNTIRPESSSTLHGREVWTGAITSFTATRVSLPAAWGGQQVAFRWLLVHNSAGTQVGWNVDDVKFSTASYIANPFRPFVSLAVSGTRISEASPDSSVTLTLSTPLPLVHDLVVDLALAGAAAATDLSGPLTVTIPAGQTSVTTQLAAVADSLAEGEESFTLSIPVAASGFAAHEPFATLMQIEDLNVDGYSVWIALYTESGSAAAAPAADLDQDGWDNAAEYVFGTSPADVSSQPHLVPQLSVDFLELVVPPAPPGASRFAQASTNLVDWSTQGVTETATGFRVPRDGAERYLRVVYQVAE